MKKRKVAFWVLHLGYSKKDNEKLDGGSSMLRRLFCVFFTISILITSSAFGINYLNKISDAEVGYTLQPIQINTGRANEGIASDGTFFYTSFGFQTQFEGICVYSPSWHKNNLIDTHYINYNLLITHIGDIDVSGNYLYAPLTDYISGSFSRNLLHIALFDKYTLDLLHYYDLSYWSEADSYNIANGDLAGVAVKDDRLYVIEYQEETSRTPRIFSLPLDKLDNAISLNESDIWVYEHDSLYANGIAFKGDYVYITWDDHSDGLLGTKAWIDMYFFPELSESTKAIPIATYEFDADRIHGEGLTFNGTQLWVAQDNYVYNIESPQPPTYTVSPSSGFHGRITPSTKVYVEHGGTETFYGIPDPGYMVDKWYTNGSVVTGSEDWGFLELSNIQNDIDVIVTFKIDNSSIGDLTVDRPAAEPYETGESSVMCSGTAPSNTQYVLWENTTTGGSGDTGDPPGTTWAERIPLDDGQNYITFFAYDFNNNLIATTSVTVIRVDNIRQANGTNQRNCWVASGKPDRNYDGIVFVGCDPSGGYYNERGLVKFDLPSLPFGSTITSARFSARTTPGYHTGNGTMGLDVRRITSSWNETTATWNSQPSHTTNAQSTENIDNVDNQWFYWDVTGIAQEWDSGSPNYGMMMISQSENISSNLERVFDNGDFGLEINYSIETELPIVQITSPTTELTYTTGSSSITLAGTASDNIQVDHVEYINQTTGIGGVASGTNSWSCSVSLEIGSNVVSIIAYDASGNSENDTITIYYLRPPNNVTATNDIANYVFVQWESVDDASYYRVYRSESEMGMMTSVSGWIDSLSFVDPNVVSGVSYYYWITASADNTGSSQSDYSIPAIGQLLPPPNPDITGEGRVDLADYAILARQWQNSPCTEPNWCNGADIDHSGAVGLEDFLIIAEHWLEGSLSSQITFTEEAFIPATNIGVNRLSGIELSPNESSLYVAYWADTSSDPVEEYSLVDYSLINTMSYGRCHDDVGISSSGRYVYISSYYQNNVSRFDLNNSNLRTDLPANYSWPSLVAVTPDKQKLIALGGRDGRSYDMNNDGLSVYDISGDNFELLGAINLPDEPAGHTVAFSQDSNYVYIVTKPRDSVQPMLYEVSIEGTYEITSSIAIDSLQLNSVAMVGDEIYISDGTNSRLVVIDTTGGFTSVERTYSLESSPGAIKLGPNGRDLYVLMPNDNKLMIWDTVEEYICGSYDQLNDNPDDIAFCSDGRVFISNRSTTNSGIQVLRCQF